MFKYTGTHHSLKLERLGSVCVLSSHLEAVPRHTWRKLVATSTCVAALVLAAQRVVQWLGQRLSSAHELAAEGPVRPQAAICSLYAMRSSA